MPQFNYRMAHADGTIHQGAMSAADVAQVASRVRDQGGILIWARQARHPRNTRGARMARSIGRRELIGLTNHLQTAIATGIPLLDAIRGYATHLDDPALGRTLERLADHVESGSSLATALATLPRLFPPLYIHMVEAGEETGQLDRILGDLAVYLEWRDEMAQDLRQATVYPSVVLLLVTGLVTFLLSFVLPRFIGIFEGGHIELPLATRVLMAVGAIFSNYWPYLIVGAVAAVVAFKLARRRPGPATWLDGRLLGLPLFGTAVRMICLSQLSYSLGLLLGSGVDITRALSLSQGVVGNRMLAARVGRVADMVNAGHGLSDALADNNLFPPLAQQMLAAGEQSGTLPEAMARTTDYLQKDIKSRLKMAFSILEPAITLFLGVVVGGIALTIFYTLYTMIMAIGGPH